MGVMMMMNDKLYSIFSYRSSSSRGSAMCDVGKKTVPSELEKKTQSDLLFSLVLSTSRNPSILVILMLLR